MAAIYDTLIKGGTIIDGLRKPRFRGDLGIADEALAVGEVEKAWDYPAGAWRLVRRPRGYRHIMVNGEVTFTDNACTGSTPGRLLRHGSARN